MSFISSGLGKQVFSQTNLTFSVLQIICCYFNAKNYEKIAICKNCKKKKKKKNCRQTYRQKDGHDIVKGYNFPLSRGPKSQSEM